MLMTIQKSKLNVLVNEQNQTLRYVEVELKQMRDRVRSVEIKDKIDKCINDIVAVVKKRDKCIKETEVENVRNE